MEQGEALETSMIMLAERMGWTLDYIDGMDDAQYLRVLEVLDALDKAKALRR